MKSEKWYTSDPHLGHKNIIKYCSRPFTDITEMNRTIIDNINARVKPFDTLYIIGDFAFGPRPAIEDYLKRIHCQNVVLVRGNHDRSTGIMKLCGFKHVYEKLLIDEELDGKLVKVYMQHHPSKSTNLLSDYGANYMLCGHVHGNWARRGNMINVGVDVSDFRPLTFQELVNRIQPNPNPHRKYNESDYNCKSES